MSTYDSATLKDAPAHYLAIPPDESGATFEDATANDRDGTGVGGYSRGADSLLAGFPNDGAVNFDGTGRITTGYGTRRNRFRNPSIETNAQYIRGLAISNCTETADERSATWSEDGTYAHRWAGTHSADSNPATAALDLFDHATATTPASGLAVTAGQSLTFGATYNITDAPSTGTLRAEVNWYTAASAFISASTVATIGTTAGERFVTGTVTAPPTAAFAIVRAWNLFSWTTNADTFEIFTDGIIVLDGSVALTAADYHPTVAQLASGEAGWLGTAHASASDIGAIANGAPRSWEGWHKRADELAAHTLFGTDATSNATRLVLASGSGNVLWIVGGTTYTFTDAWPDDAEPHHWMLAFDEANDTADLYIDGVLFEAKTGVSAQHAAGQTLQWGAHGSGSDGFDGDAAKLASYELLLAGAAARSHYRLGTEGPSKVRVLREQMPATQITAVSTSGYRYRWAKDEAEAANVPSGLRYGTSMPGGSDTLNATLPRDPDRSYPDQGLLAELQVSRDGGRTQTYRLEETPKVSGDQMAVEPAARGHRAALEDRSDVRALFVDRDLGRWQSMSRARRIALLSGSYDALGDFSVAVDVATGLPALMLTVTSPWTNDIFTAAWYDAGDGGRMGSIYYDWTLTGSTSASWTGRIDGKDDDAGGGSAAGTDVLTGGSSGTRTETAVAGKRYAEARLDFPTAVSTNVEFIWALRKLAVFGNHGLTAQGTAPGGFYTGPMLQWLIENETSLSVGTIDNGTFLHPHAAYLDPQRSLGIVENLTRYEPLYDWMVYGNELSFRRRGTYGKRWRARVGPSGLRGAGQQIGRLWNQIAVRVQDPLYGEVIVGPTGSGYANTSADLIDTDPDNPANQAGITRRDLLDIGEGTIEGATEVGRRFLEETKRLDNSGQCTLTGFVEDDAGILWPVDEVQAGDEISFTDSADTSWRFVSTTSYDEDSRTNQLSIDAPARTLEALLSRLQAVLVPLG